MSGWAYGLVEENGELRLMEVYDVNGSFGFAHVDWKDINKDNYEMIIDDITQQLKSIFEDKKRKYKFKVKNNDINKEKYYIYALDKKIGKVVVHVIINGEAISLVTGNKFKLKKNKRGNIGVSETKVRFEVKKDDKR